MKLLSWFYDCITDLATDRRLKNHLFHIITLLVVAVISGPAIMGYNLIESLHWGLVIYVCSLMISFSCLAIGQYARKVKMLSWKDQHDDRSGHASRSNTIK